MTFLESIPVQVYLFKSENDHTTNMAAKDYKGFLFTEILIYRRNHWIILMASLHGDLLGALQEIPQVHYN